MNVWPHSRAEAEAAAVEEHHHGQRLIVVVLVVIIINVVVKFRFVETEVEVEFFVEEEVFELYEVVVLGGLRLFLEVDVGTQNGAVAQECEEAHAILYYVGRESHFSEEENVVLVRESESGDEGYKYKHLRGEYGATLVTLLVGYVREWRVLVSLWCGTVKVQRLLRP